MATVKEKSETIWAHETVFADALAVRVLDRPKLSVWMILVPIIFVYFFYRYQRFVAGRKAFSDKYLINRRRALEEAAAIVETGKKPDIAGPDPLDGLPEDVRQCNAEVLKVLVEHYADLLRSSETSFAAMVRTVYRSKTNYLLYINRLQQAEKRFNAVLEPHLSDTTEQVDLIMRAIETHSDALRRDSADDIFTAGERGS